MFKTCVDVVTWNAMLEGFVRDGLVVVMEKMFEEMPQRDVKKFISIHEHTLLIFSFSFLRPFEVHHLLFLYSL